MPEVRRAQEEDPSTGMKHSVFLNSLEQWIDEKISQDGLGDEALIKMIKENFELSIQANVTHHKFMMTTADKSNDKKRADQHRLMADVYQALLPEKYNKPAG